MGREPALSKVTELLRAADPSKLEATVRVAREIEKVQIIIDTAKRLLRMKVLLDDGSINSTYLKVYKQYIDMKVIYNRIEYSPTDVPRNHNELIRIHQQVREQHRQIQNLPQMREPVRVS